MATAHAQLIADLNDRPFDAATKRMDRSMESFALDAVREFERVETAAKESSKEIERSFQQALSSYNLAREKMSRGLPRGDSQVAADNAMMGRRHQNEARGSNRFFQGAGQVGLQLQDVAVQIQSGTKASTILLQQGTQIASIFGPTGAIIGGLAGILAMVGAWAIGLDKVIAREEKLAKEAQKRAALMKDIFGGAADAEKEAMHSTRRRLFGDDEADKIKRFEDHEERIQKIRNSRLDVSGVAQDAEKKRFQEAEKLIEHQTEIANKAAQDREQAAMAGLKRTNAALKAQAAGEAPQDSTMRLAKDYSELIAQRDKLSGQDWIEKDNEAMQTLVEMTKLARTETENFTKEQEQQAEKMQQAWDGAREAAQDLARSVKKSISNVWDDFAKGAENAMNNALAMAQAKMITRGQSILQDAQDILDPKSAKERDRQQRREDNAIRAAAERKVGREDNEARNREGFGLTKEQREARVQGKIRDAEAARNRANNVSINPDDITKLAQSIATENNKLIAK